MYYLLYEITNLVNGKNYIGQHTTENVDDGYMGSGMAIMRAVKKYGKENFKKEILLYAKNEVALNFFERALVTPEFIELNTNYNLKEGGGNGKLSTEVRKKLSAIGKKRKHSSSTKAKISAANKGRKLPPITHETRAKLILAAKRKAKSPEYRAKLSAAKAGRKLSFEHAAKISASKIGKKRAPEVAKKVWETRRKNKLLKSLQLLC